jgi:hypothetical protein
MFSNIMALRTVKKGKENRKKEKGEKKKKKGN